MKYFWLFLLLTTRAFAAAYIGSANANVSYTTSVFSLPYTTAQNASGNFFYVTVGIDANSSSALPTSATWNGQTGIIIQLIGYLQNAHDGICVFQFSSPATITSSNVTITSTGVMGYPAVTLDEFSGTSGVIGGVGYAVGGATTGSLTVSNFTIGSASSISFSAAVGSAGGSTTQPAGWSLLENGISSGHVITTSSWGISVTGATGTNPFAWTFSNGYAVAAAFEMEIGIVPTATSTPTPSATPTSIASPTSTPTPTPAVSSTPTLTPTPVVSSTPTSVPVFAVTNVPTPIWRSQPCSLYALAPVTNWTQVNCSCTVQAGCTVELDISSTALCNWSFTRTTAASIPANVNGATALVGSSYVLPLGYNENLWYKCNCPDTLSETAQPCW